MTKSLEAAVVTQLDAQAKRPVLLFELGLSTTLRFAAYRSSVVFPTGGDTYTAKAIKVSGISQSAEGELQRVTVEFDNVSRDMAAYADAEDFRGKSLVIKRVFLDAVASADNYVEVFNGTMEAPGGIGRQWLSLTAVCGKAINKKALSVAYQRACPWVFGGTECNTDSNADLTSLTASGTADSGTTSTLVDDALTQADNVWKHGRIEIVKDGVTYFRTVKSFTAATDTVTFDVELPVAVDDTTTYTMYRGCNKTWNTCSGSNAWGPSADNSANFGGFLHISPPKVDYST